MIKFPYGISDFHRIRTESYLYVDRTAAIAELEEAGRQLLFLRPRRFGKSLLLSMLGNYYDINTAGEFEALFDDLAVGKAPTPEHNRYMVLRWDFSAVSPLGNIEQIQHNLFAHMNAMMNTFLERYASRLKSQVALDPANALSSFEQLLGSVRSSGYELYLLIDEYDNFANEVLMHDTADVERYRALLQGEGILKTLFKIVKASAGEGRISRVFITGVSPVVLSDMTSGYNVATSIYFEPRFNTLCGITQPELDGLVGQVLVDCGHDVAQQAAIVNLMQRFYNGYRFCYEADQPKLYNPTLCFYFLRHYQRECVVPREMLDGNLAMDAGRIRYIADLPEGGRILEQILDEQTPLTLEKIESQFGVEMLHTLQHDERFMVSLLYFFGVLTITGTGLAGDPILGVPNLVIQGLYVSQLRKSLLDSPKDDNAVSKLAREFFNNGEIQPLIDFMEAKYFKVFDNRDYRWSNELTVKTAFLTLLFNDIYYVMDSESVLERHYSDLVMTVRPNMRQYPTLKDYLFEFKFLSLGILGLDAKQVRALVRDELQQLPAVVIALQQAQQQLQQYRQAMMDKYQQPERLYGFAVVALGFERLVWVRV
jgi:hypothetical protein